MVRCSSCADSFNVWKASRSEWGNPSRITSTRWAKRPHGFMILESAFENRTKPCKWNFMPWNAAHKMIIHKNDDNCFWSMHFLVEILYSIHCLMPPNHQVASSTSSRCTHPCRYWTSPLGFWGPGVHLWWAVLGKFWGHHHVSRVASGLASGLTWWNIGHLQPISSKEWYL